MRIKDGDSWEKRPLQFTFVHTVEESFNSLIPDCCPSFDHISVAFLRLFDPDASLWVAYKILCLY